MPQLSTPPTHADGISDERRLKKQPEAERCERGHDELDDGRLEGWALVDDDEAPRIGRPHGHHEPDGERGRPKQASTKRMTPVTVSPASMSRVALVMATPG